MRIGKWAAVAGGWMLGAVVGVEASMSLYPPQHLLTEVVLDVTPDPVSAGDGAFYFAMPLLDLGGPMNLGFTLHYNSNGARSNWDLNDLPEGGPWWWDPIATLNPNPMSGTNYWQFQIEGGQAVAFTEQADGSWRLTDESAFGLANSPIAFQAMRTNTWAYFFDPRNGRIKMFENFTNNLWRIVAQTDRNGNALTYTYRPPTNWLEYLQPIRIEDDFGRWYEIEYATQGYNWEYFIDTVTDHAGRELRLEYETGGDISGSTVALRHVVDVRGGTNRFTYAPFTNSGTIYRAVIGGHRRPEGNTPWTQTYDALRLYSGDGGNRPVVTHQTDAYGHTIALTYDTNAHTVAAAWPDGRTNHFAHTGRHLPPAEATDPAGGQTLYAVNGNQQITAVTDRSGGVTGAGFDPDTRLTTAITNPSGDALTFDYAVTTQAVVNPITLETVEFVFHDLAARHWPDGTSETYERDGAGNVTGRVDRAGGRWSYEYDAHGNLTRRVDPAESEENFTYTADGLRETATTAGGGTNVFAYDDLSRLTSITYPDGTWQAYGYDLAGHLTAVSNSLGDAWTYEYDANGNLTRAVGPTGAEKVYAYDLMDRITTNAPSYAAATSFEYDAMGRIARAAAGGLTNEFQRDALGSVTNSRHGRVRRSAEYDPSGRPTAIARAGHGSATLQRDALGLVTGRVDSTGFAVQAWRDPNGVATQSVDSLARTTRWSLANGRLVSVERPDGSADLRTYADGRPATYTDFGGNAWRFGFTPEGLPSAITNPAGDVRRLEYDALGRVTRAVLENGSAWAYARDARGNLAGITTPGTATWQVACNALGQPLAVTNPAGGVLTRTYTADGLPATAASTDSGIFSNEYDTLRRLVRGIRPDGGAWQLAYEPTNGWLETVTAPGGGVYGWSYDEYGRLAALSDPDGGGTDLAYDDHGRVTGVVVRAERQLAYEYDAAGRVTAITDSTGTGQEITYDELDRPVTIAFGGVTNQYAYDAMGRLTGLSNSLFGAEWLQRDAVGMVTSRVDAAGRRTSYAADAAGNVTNILLPGGQTLDLAYDAEGQIARLELPGGSVYTYAADDLGGLTEWTDANGYTWRVERSPMGRVDATVDPLERTNRFVYDANGWLAAVEFPDGATRTYQRDLDGAVTAEVFAAAGGGAGTTNTYAYDTLGNLTAADGLVLTHDGLGQVAETVCHGVTNAAEFDAAGRLTELDYGNAMTVTYQYDPATGRLTNQFDSLTGTWIAYDYDARGRLAGIRRTSGQNAVFTRNEDGSLARIADGTVLDLEYTYDANGRVASVAGTWPLETGPALAAETNAWTYDAAGQISSAGYAYNDRGQCTASPGRTVAWLDDRPAAIDGMNLAYSGLDHLLAVGGDTTLHYNLGLGDVPVRENNRLYVWSPAGRLLYFVDLDGGNAVCFYHPDANGSMLAVSDASGTVVQAYAYDPFGQIVAESGDLQQPFTFGGETGLLRFDDLVAPGPLRKNGGGAEDLYINGKKPQAAKTQAEYEAKAAEIDRNIAIYDALIAEDAAELKRWSEEADRIDSYITVNQMGAKNPFFIAAKWILARFNDDFDTEEAWKKNDEANRRREFARKRIERHQAEIRKWEARKEALRPKAPPIETAKTRDLEHKIDIYRDLIAKERRDMRERRAKIDKKENQLCGVKTANFLNTWRWVFPGPGRRNIDAREAEIEDLCRFQQLSRQRIEKYDAEIEKIEEDILTERTGVLIRQAEEWQKQWEQRVKDAEEKAGPVRATGRGNWVRAARIVKELQAQATAEDQEFFNWVDEGLKSLEEEMKSPPANELVDPVEAPQPKTENNAAVVTGDNLVDVPAFTPANYDEKAGAVLNQWMPDEQTLRDTLRNTPVNAGELWVEHQLRKAEFGYDPWEIDPEVLKKSLENTPVNAGEIWLENLMNESK